MSQIFTAACVQNCATPDVAHDVGVLSRLVREAGRQGAKFVALPEYCAGVDTKNGLLFPHAAAEAVQTVGRTLDELGFPLTVGVAA